MTDPSDGSVHLERFSDTRLDVVLDRPEKLNALSQGMLVQILALAQQIRRERPRVVVVRSTSLKAFCVGADLIDQQNTSPSDAFGLSELGNLAFDAIAALPQPVVAQISGYCIGGGLELALACDIRICDGTAKFAFPETGIGNSPAWGGTARLTSLVGPSRALELLLTGETLNAEAACKIGVVNRVAADTSAQAVNEFCEVVEQKAPLAQTAAKRAVFAALPPSRPFYEAAHAAFQATTSDAQHGKDAFAHHWQSPKFKGR